MRSAKLKKIQREHTAALANLPHSVAAPASLHRSGAIPPARQRTGRLRAPKAAATSGIASADTERLRRELSHSIPQPRNGAARDALTGSEPPRPAPVPR